MAHLSGTCSYSPANRTSTTNLSSLKSAHYTLPMGYPNYCYGSTVKRRDAPRRSETDGTAESVCLTPVPRCPAQAGACLKQFPDAPPPPVGCGPLRPKPAKQIVGCFHVYRPTTKLHKKKHQTSGRQSLEENTLVRRRRHRKVPGHIGTGCEKLKNVPDVVSDVYTPCYGQVEHTSRRDRKAIKRELHTEQTSIVQIKRVSSIWSVVRI